MSRSMTAPSPPLGLAISSSTGRLPSESVLTLYRSRRPRIVLSEAGELSTGSSVPGRQLDRHYQQPAQLFWNTGTRSARSNSSRRPRVGRTCSNPSSAGVRLPRLRRRRRPRRRPDRQQRPGRLFRNDQTLGHHRIRLTLEADGTTSNTSAIGAEVVVEAGGKTMVRTVTGAKGYLSQSELTVTVGLGSTTIADKVTVRWPGKAGLKQTWMGLAADGTYLLKQNRPDALRR